MICMRSEFELTPEQRTFAHEHHGLLMKFIGTYHLSDDYYGPLAERYLCTVKQYMEKPALQKYAFSTILWYRLRKELSCVWKKEKRYSPNLSLDDMIVVPGHSDDTSEFVFWADTGEVVTKQQLDLLTMKADGIPMEQIADHFRCSKHAVSCRAHRIKKKLKKNGVI